VLLLHSRTPTHLYRYAAQDFLTNQRNWTFHSEIVPLKEREKEESLPEGTLTSRMADEWNAENIDAKLSTRMQALARLLEHYLTPGAKPTFFNRDGSRDLEAEAELKENLDPSDKPRKVLLFVVFGLHRDLTKKVNATIIAAVHHEGSPPQ
jgi:hypothetical protein